MIRGLRDGAVWVDHRLEAALQGEHREGRPVPRHRKGGEGQTGRQQSGCDLKLQKRACHRVLRQDLRQSHGVTYDLTAQDIDRAPVRAGRVSRRRLQEAQQRLQAPRRAGGMLAQRIRRLAPRVRAGPGHGDGDRPLPNRALRTLGSAPGPVQGLERQAPSLRPERVGRPVRDVRKRPGRPGCEADGSLRPDAGLGPVPQAREAAQRRRPLSQEGGIEVGPDRSRPGTAVEKRAEAAEQPCQDCLGPRI